LKARRIVFFLMLIVLLGAAVCGCTGDDQSKPADAVEPANTEESAVEPVVEKAAGINPVVQIEGNVNTPCEISLDEFAGSEVTISAEEKQCKETIPARDFTGIPLRVILEKSQPAEDAAKLTMLASDGYKKSLPLEDVLAGDDLIMLEEDGVLRVIARGYDASYWVSDVLTLKVQ